MMVQKHSQQLVHSEFPKLSHNAMHASVIVHSCQQSWDSEFICVSRVLKLEVSFIGALLQLGWT